MKRSRESAPSGIYYGREFSDFLVSRGSRFVKLYAWWDGIKSDPMFWKLLIYGMGLGFLIVALSL